MDMSAAHRPPTPVAAGLAATATAIALVLGTALMGGLAGAGAAVAAPAQEEFTVSGDIDGLYPGAVATMDAHVENPWDVAIEVTSVVVHVADANPGCPGSVLDVAATTESVTVAPLSEAVVPVEVAMDAGAGEACRGATWPLEFTARAVGPDGDARTGTEPDDPAGAGGPAESGATGPGAGDSGDSASSAADRVTAFAYTGAWIAAAVALGLTLVGVGVLFAWARRRRAARAQA